MLKVENARVFNIEGAFRGMRNPMASWAKADSEFDEAGQLLSLGEADKNLALRLVQAGSDHGKFIRQIFVCMDIIAPDYWWKEMDTYKVGTVANSTSSMHTITSRNLDLDDFSFDEVGAYEEDLIDHLNTLIKDYKQLLSEDRKPDAKKVWRKLIQDLPMSFNYRRTWTGDYQNLRNMYFARENHRLIEWEQLRQVIEALPLSMLITTKKESGA